MIRHTLGLALAILLGSMLLLTATDSFARGQTAEGAKRTVKKLRTKAQQQQNSGQQSQAQGTNKRANQVQRTIPLMTGVAY
jgi:hypothetical protein